MATLHHPNIAELHEVHGDEKCIHLITTLYKGGNLFEQIVEKGTFNEAEAKGIMRQILEALAHAHAKGIAHRDLKPENIIFESEEAGAPVRVIDFGMSKAEDPRRQQRESEAGGPWWDGPSTSFVGTPLYMAPETVSGRVRSWAKADLWATGVVLQHAMLAGYPPFLATAWPALAERIRFAEPAELEGVSPEGRDLLRRLLAKDPRGRPGAAEALRHPWFGG
ncbi:unnamed protein product, partial [Heterosigma akashiwo]